jgi:phosphatidylserine/phosphatidylglycerophosphate/cardiolipin synthase-like enzyme
VLISTYGIYGGREIFHNLAARMDQNADLRVSIFMNVSQTTSSVEHFREHHWPQQSRLPKIYYDARSLDNNPVESSVLHSKCLVIDAKEVLVTSANFTEAAQRRNIEVGLLVKSEVLAGQVTRFFESLMNSAHCRQAV